MFPFQKARDLYIYIYIVARTGCELFQSRATYAARAADEGYIFHKTEMSFPHEKHILYFITRLHLCSHHLSLVYLAINFFRCSQGLEQHGNNQLITQGPVIDLLAKLICVHVTV